MKAIYPVIVLYKTTLAQSQSYQTLIRPHRIEEFMVYDNSPADFEQLVADWPEGVTYVRDNSNGGLSKAYNAGARKAASLGYQRVLLLDQDTRFEVGIWDKYLAQISYPGIVAPLMKTQKGENFSPVDIRGWNLKGWEQAVPGEYSQFEAAVVNSGSCIPVTLFQQTGGYIENVKLDFADFQFQVLARQYQPRFRVIDSVAIQDFSNDMVHVPQLLHRYRLYLQSASAFVPDSLHSRVKHHYQVLRHGLALFLRTRHIQFLTNYIKIFVLKRS